MTDVKTSLYNGDNKLLIFSLIALALYMSRALTPRTGGALNPAMGISLTFFHSIYTGNWSYFRPWWIYVAGPLSGACLAGLHYKFIHTPMAMLQD